MTDRPAILALRSHAGTAVHGVINELCFDGRFQPVPTTTTPSPCPDEIGVGRRFLCIEEFARLKRSDQLAEWQDWPSFSLGTTVHDVMEIAGRGKHAVLAADVRCLPGLSRRAGGIRVVDVILLHEGERTRDGELLIGTHVVRSSPQAATEIRRLVDGTAPSDT